MPLQQMFYFVILKLTISVWKREKCYKRNGETEKVLPQKIKWIYIYVCVFSSHWFEAKLTNSFWSGGLTRSSADLLHSRVLYLLSCNMTFYIWIPRMFFFFFLQSWGTGDANLIVQMTAVSDLTYFPPWFSLCLQNKNYWLRSVEVLH